MRLTLLSVVLTASVVLATHGALNAQTKTIPGDTTTITATVEAIDANTRTLTVKGPGGNLVPITVSKAVERFSEIKVGDTITARYYDNIIIRVKPAGEKPVDTWSESLTRGAAAASPAGTAAMQRTITATIVAIDNKVPSISFKGETVNWTYSSRVEDKEALAKVKVGDRVDITWTEALNLSVKPQASKD